MRSKTRETKKELSQDERYGQTSLSQAQWHRPVIPALRRPKQKTEIREDVVHLGGRGKIRNSKLSLAIY